MAEKSDIGPSTETQHPLVMPDSEKVSLHAASDASLDKRMMRKIDLHLMTPLWILFLFGFMDRINLGNVSTLGMLQDLHLTGNEFNIALQVFFVPYILLDIPSNLVLKKLKPSAWIAMLAFGWGVCCMCQGFVQSNGGLIACRFFIGTFEAGFVPGCSYLMSMYYPRHEFQKRLSLFWCAGLVAGAFSGLLAYAIVHLNDVQGYAGWRWVLIIEGLLSISAAGPAYFVLADWPEQAKFLSQEEKSRLATKMALDIGGQARMDRLDKAAWKRIMRDWKIYVGSFLYLGITVSGYATALFVPSILATLGYSGIETQIHSIPVWIVSAVVTFGVSILTDRLRHRYSFIMFGVLFASIGYIILLAQGDLPTPQHPSAGLNVGVRYMAVFFVTVGCYIVQPVAIVWFANNLAGHYKRAVGIAIQIGFGNIGGIIASNVFVRNQAPRYFVGYGVSLAMLLFCGVMSTVFAIGLVRENRKRERGEGNDLSMLPEFERQNLGDDDPSFRFSL